jgi:hypothetical protein
LRKEEHLLRRETQIIFLSGLLLLLSAQTVLMAQDTAEKAKVPVIQYRNKGDMIGAINLGVFFPLYFEDFSSGTSEFNETNMSMGGLFVVSYDVYINGFLRLGLQVIPSFSYSPNEQLLYMIPVLARFTYEWQPVKEFSIPLSLGAGVSFNTYGEDFHLDYIVKPTIGLYWNMDIEFSFGVDVSYWWMPQLYDNADYNRIAHFVEISIGAQYHF